MVTRLSPEVALELAHKTKRGKLKIFLGYAPGVGKTCAMLNEGKRRVKYGQNVMIGALDTHGRSGTEKAEEGIEIIPMKKVLYKGKELEILDVDSIIDKKPEVVLVDELAKTNPPCCSNKKRYEDILEILDAGINVLTTVNIQHIESLNLLTTNITRINVTETIPDEILEKADEVIVIDISPEELIRRVKEGKVFTDSLKNKSVKYFQKNALSALRELCLKVTANEVEDDLFSYLKSKNIISNWHVAERVLVIIDLDASARKLIIRGERMAKRFNSELFIMAPKCKYSKIFYKKYKKKNARLERLKAISEEVKGEFIVIKGSDYFIELKKFIEENFITCVIVGNKNQLKSKYINLIKMKMITRLIKESDNVEFHIIPVD